MDSKFLDDSSQFGYDSQDETESVETDNENGSERGYSAFGKDINYTGFDEQAYVRRRSNSRPSRSLRRKTLDGDMFGEREMTLRLTLTKPEARDDGTGWFMDHAQQENDAFELQQQQRMREHIAMQRAVSRDGKKQNLFSRFKGRR